MTQKPQESKHSRKAWAAICCAWLVCILNAGPAAAESGRQSMVYEVYAGGIHAVQATMNVDFSKKGHYRLMLEAKTRGFLASLAPWQGSFESAGWVIKSGDFQPELHKSVAVWRDEEEIKEYRYTKDGGFQELIVTDHGELPEKKDIDAALTEGTTDAFTAALLVMDQVAKGGKCEGESEVFDGKRRFRQIFRDEGTEQLEPTKYNIFKGPAAQCTVEVVPGEGEWHEKPRGWMSIQEQGRERGTMPTIWLAQLQNGMPAVPVKIRVKTAYGTLFMHLAEYRDEDRVVVANKRAEDGE